MKLLPVAVMVFLVMVVSGCTTQFENSFSEESELYNNIEFVESGIPGYIGTTKEFYSIDGMKEMNGKLIWTEKSDLYVDGERSIPITSDDLASKKIIGIEHHSIIAQDGNGFYHVSRRNFTGFDYVFSVVLIDNNYAVFGDRNREFLISYNGLEFGKDLDLVYSRCYKCATETSKLVSINDKLAYEAGLGTEKPYVVYDDIEYGEEYDSAHGPLEIDGKFSYYAKRGESTFLIVDGKEYGSGYFNIEHPFMIGEKIAYLAHKSTYKDTSIFVGDEEFGSEYDEVDCPININGKLAYLAIDNDKRFIVFDDEEIGKDFSYVYCPREVGGKLAFLMINRYINSVPITTIFYDNAEVGSEVPRGISYFIEYNEKLAFVAYNYNEITKTRFETLVIEK